MFRDSLEEETLSYSSLHALISNVGRGINCVKVPMLPRILFEEGIHINQKRRECTNNDIQLRLRPITMSLVRLK